MKLTRDDIVRALKEVGTYMDITVDDLMGIYMKAEKYAELRSLDRLLVRDVMSTPVTTIHYARTLAAAAHLLVTNKISGLPVIGDAEELVGVITEADFLRALGVPSPHPTQTVWDTLEGMFSPDVKPLKPEEQVSNLMNAKVITISPEKTLREVLDIMKKHKIKRVVVCDADRTVVGMVARSDLVRVFFDRITGPHAGPL
jgi:CBS domain-containing membrane protein